MGQVWQMWQCGTRFDIYHFNLHGQTPAWFVANLTHFLLLQISKMKQDVVIIKVLETSQSKHTKMSGQSMQNQQQKQSLPMAKVELRRKLIMHLLCSQRNKRLSPKSIQTKSSSTKQSSKMKPAESACSTKKSKGSNKYASSNSTSTILSLLPQARECPRKGSSVKASSNSS